MSTTRLSHVIARSPLLGGLLLSLVAACGDDAPPPSIPDTRTAEEIVPALGELRVGLDTAQARIRALSWPTDLSALPRCAVRLAPAERADVAVIELGLRDAFADPSDVPLLDRLTARAGPTNALLDALGMPAEIAAVEASAAAEPTPDLADWTRSSGLVGLEAPAERALEGVRPLARAPRIALVRASTYVPPTYVTAESFVGGRYEGDAVVFDVASHAALCVQGVSAQSGDSVPTYMRGPPLWDQLTADLVDRALASAQASLAAGVDVPSPAGPPATRARARRPSTDGARPGPPPPTDVYD